MINNERIIVTMTSYPKRIGNVAKSIYFLLSRQTVKPDEIHLWLAEPEFPNHENDLPADLNKILEVCDEEVFIHWLPKNTYCHKRHEIFRYTKDTDCVFIFDDDVKYDDRLIETVMNDHKRFPNAIINYNGYSAHYYRGKKIIYTPDQYPSEPSVDVRYCGQSMIPSKIYPREVLEDKNIEIRDRICPICDESWFTPWLVYHNIPIYCERFGWGIDISPKINKWDGLCSYTRSRDANGLERRDNWLYAVLSSYDFLMSTYKERYYYDR